MRFLFFLPVLVWVAVGCFSAKPATRPSQPTPPIVTTPPTNKPVEPPILNPNPTRPHKSDPPNRPDTVDKGPSANKSFEIACVLPLYLDQFSPNGDSLISRAVLGADMLAGVLLAAEQLQAEGANMTFTIFDSQEKGGFQSVLNKPELLRADVVFGPAERDFIETAAAFAAANRKTVVSMYAPSADVAAGSKYFVQLNPSLETHCATITDYVLSKYTPDQVVLVARGVDNEDGRFEYFQKALRRISKDNLTGNFKELVITDNSPAMANTNLTPFLLAGKETVFIVPSWNESFVSALLRKIDATKKNSKVTVIGMPHWADFNHLDFVYFERLNIILSGATYQDSDSPDWLLFRQTFYERYHKTPSKEACAGYDGALFTGRMVRKYGPDFVSRLGSAPIEGTQTRFRLTPRKASDVTGSTENLSTLMKYENDAVYLFYLENGKFVPIR